MTTANETMHKAGAAELVIIREFNAPRERVFNAWAEPEQLTQWWGPQGMKIEIANLDLRPGGIFHYSMAGPDGQKMWGRFVYQEIQSPDRLVFTSSFSDEEGGIVRAPFSEQWPLEVMNTLVLKEEDGKTILELRGGPVNATADEMSMFGSMTGNIQQGFKGTFDRLEEYLAAAK